VSATPTVTLYGKPGCHLCDDAREWITALVEEGRSVELVEVDVSSDPALEHEYGVRIPVVSVDGVEVSELELDREAVLTRIDRVTA
jgi:glutaredoxin